MSDNEIKDPRVKAVLKHKLETDFLFFVRYFFKNLTGQKFIVSDHHRIIEDHIYKVTSAEILRLIVNIPPRYGKTEMLVVMFIAWCIAKNPRAKFIHLSYSDELAFDNSSRIKELILSDAFQEIWPHISLKDDAKSKKKWYTTQGGGVYATSSGGAVTGFGAGSTASEAQEDVSQEKLEELEALGIDTSFLETSDDGLDPNLFYGAIIVDDPLKPGDAESPTVRKTINKRMSNTIASRVNSRKTPIIVVMQRLHEEDTTGFLLDGGTGDTWTHLKLAALTEDPVTGEKRALWPFKHTVAELERQRDADAYVFSGQMQQEPTPASGGVVSIDWFGRYNAPPVEFEQIVFSCDTAYKPKEVNDPSVISVFGKYAKRWYLLEVWRRRAGYPELKRTLINMSEVWSPHAILIEDKASGQSLIQDAREEGLPVIAIEPEANKIIRMSNQSPLVEAGLVMLPEKATWLYDFEQEVIHFPKSKHDDQVDTLSQLLKWQRTQSLSVALDYDDIDMSEIDDELEDFY